MDLTGQTVAVLGAGRSGRAAAELACRLGGTVALYDSRGAEAFGDILEGIAVHPGATVETGRSVQADLVVVSPGIETGGDFVQSFAEGSGELIGEIELASRVYEGRVVGITGTNGKTTTTELIQRILEAGGMSCAAAGNYGVPLAEVVLRADVPETVALELSSFQLETIRSFRPEVAVWLNFSPDHMDRYQAEADYRQAKFRIFENQTGEDHAVVRFGEELGALAASCVTFSSVESSADYSLEGTRICRDGAVVGDLSQTKMRGLHNAENVMAALAVGDAMGVSSEVAMSSLASYAPPVHRCELVGILDGVEYVNDSKATNLHALESALRSQSNPTVLIAGGKDKGLDYRPVLPLLAEKVTSAILIGEIRESLGSLLEGVVATEMAASMEEAVRSAAGCARAGSTVLLSPGTSSFDMFSGYEERGEAFRAAVQKLK
jgi:UDP-N-acetylmuramoylalanine--D-glutamate ligase